MPLRTYLAYAFLHAASAVEAYIRLTVNSQETADIDVLYHAFSSPNATGRYAISGPNVTSPYPGTMIDGWELEVDVVANVPGSRGETAGKFISAVGFKLNPPPALIEDFENGTKTIKADQNSWLGCVNMFLPTGVPGPAGDGTCSGLLSSNCIANIKKAMANSPRTTQGHCPMLWAVTNAQQSECPLGEFSYSTSIPLDETVITGYEAAYEADAIDNIGDLSAYNNLGTMTYPVIITWGHSNETSENEAVPEDHVVVACVSANVTTPGSKIAAGNGLGVGLLGMALTTMGAVFVLLL